MAGPGTSGPASGSSRATPGAQGSSAGALSSLSSDYEATASKLKDPIVDLKTKVGIASDLRDNVEVYSRDADPSKFFDHLLPSVIDVLRNGKPSFVSTAQENKFRNLLLQILHRLPHVEALRPHAAKLMELMLHLLRVENEDNAIVAMKIILDLHRTYSRAPASGSAQNNVVENTTDEFLDVVADLFKAMPAVVEETFADPQAGSAQNAQSPSAPPPADENASVQLPPAMKSFKLLQDCPAAIVFIFQSYRPMVNKAVTTFVPLVFEFLQLQAAPQARKHASMEPGKSWVGMCPEIVKYKSQAFQDMVMAQTKTMSFLAYILRVSATALQSYLNVLPDIAIRLMKDCPSSAVAMKRDLLIATRHILQSELRSSFLGQIDTLLDDHVLIGNGVTGYENLRPLAFSMLADLIHHVRTELSLPQMARIVHVYAANVHDPTLASAIQTMCSKLLLNLIDPISVKEPVEASKLFERMLEIFVTKMESMAEIRDEWAKWAKPRPSLSSKLKAIQERAAEQPAEKKEAETEKMEVDDKADGEADKAKPKEESDAKDEKPATTAVPVLDEVDIERAKPIMKTTVMVDPGPDPVKDARFLFRNLLFGFKTITASLARLGVVPPSVDMLRRFFEASVKCLILFDAAKDQGREQKEVMEVLSSTLVQTDLLVFQEVVESRMEFFVEELIRNHELLVIPQSLLSTENVSSHFVAILFNFLTSRLPELGKANKEYTSVMLRLYKMSFMAVTIFPDKNEPVLLPHLSNLIMNSLKLASSAEEPQSYYLLLRALFRSIGGGRFEILYKEVLPLLQTLLEQLNTLLNAADKTKKDLFAELILTVPVRLSVLLPYLSYLMRPLVHALQAGPELVSQGLRTLELCVDNLTQEFLNPLMSPVIDEVMVGLWKLLRPLPFNHQHAHTTARILGKIGGRNRKGFSPLPLEWKPITEEALFNMSFDGKEASMKLAPIVDVALKSLKRGDLHYRKNAYTFLKNAVVTFLKDTLPHGECEETFGNILKGLFTATRIDDFSADAETYVQDLASYVFGYELSKEFPENLHYARQLLPVSSAFVDAVIENLCTAESHELEQAATQTQNIVKILLKLRKSDGKTKLDPPTALLHQMGSRLCSQCYEPSWQRKTGAAKGLSILTSKVDLEIKWILDHEIECTRALLFALKDMPGESPPNADMVGDTLLHIIRVCNEKNAREETPVAKAQMNYLVGLLLLEVCSQVASVRQIVKKALEIVSELTETPLTELLMPVRDRLLTPIFTKPLRALGFTMQIGHIDAVTYCISLDPPLIEFDDQLARLLSEALGIADAEDIALMGGKSNVRTTAPLTQLRVVCVQLLNAAQKSKDFQQPKHQQMRLKALSVFFKLLYTKPKEVVDAAYNGLKQVMDANGKLPKDLLQAGLKPVLMNLSDHKRLSIGSLQGLARLLELLTNYFKVEIGVKLVDHFKSLAIPDDIVRSAMKQSSDDGCLAIMAGIVNVFHLLPHPAAGQFLEEIVRLVVDVERLLKKLKGSLFTQPLTLYLQVYPSETVKFFFANLHDERFVPTFQAVIASEHGGSIRETITSSAGDLLKPCFQSDGDLACHAALVIRELIANDPSWIVSTPGIVEMLIQRWVSGIRRERLAAQGDAHFQQLREDAVVMDIFLAYLDQAEHIDLLFHAVDVYTYWTSANHARLSLTLCRKVALSKDVVFKRKILDRFIDIFANNGVTKAHKTAALRLLVNPILLISFSRGDAEADLVDAEFLNAIHKKIWNPLLKEVPDMASFEEEALRIELCHMSTLLVKAKSEIIVEPKKDLIKFGWVNIKLDDITTTQAAYVLIANFLERYESPGKIVLQIYAALLKAHQSEARALVREALDALAPSLPKRLTSGTDGNVPSVPFWAKYTRKMLTDESGSMPLLINIYQLIVRHPDLFFGPRELFVPHMVASLAKLTLGQSITPDTRGLTLDVIELIAKWEKKRLELSKQEETKMDVDATAADEEPAPKRAKVDRAASQAPSTTSTALNSYAVPGPLRDQVVNNLLRFIANSNEVAVRNNLVARALALLRELIGPIIWSETNVKLAFFQRTFAQNEVNDDTIVLLCNSADVLNIVVSTKSSDWITTNMATLHAIVEKGFSSSEFRLHSALRPIIEKLFEAIPSSVTSESADSPAELRNYVGWAVSYIKEALESQSSLPGAMMLLQAWAKADAERVDQFIEPLIKVYGRLTREHVSSPTPVSSADPQLRLLVSSLEVIRQRVAVLGENRRWFLSCIVQLVEKSSNLDVCRFLLQMTRKWVQEKAEPFPTPKEKAGILIKMMAFENRNSEALQREYLSLILDIYTDASLARSDLTVRLEPAFLTGCKMRDPVIRSKFLAVFDKSLGTSLFGRLHYLLGVQSWEPLAEMYWIHQALDLLLGAADSSIKLFVKPESLPDVVPESLVKTVESYTSGDLVGSARKLLYADPTATHAVWVSVFKTCWTCLSRREQLDTTKFIITLLTKEYHLRTVDRRPNVVQTILAGALASAPLPSLPPHLVRYLAKTFNAWYTGIEIITESLENPREEESIRESMLDALAETYSELSEDDLFYGLWRRRAGYNETNVAVSWEQIGQWGQAQLLYETAQITARSGVLPFSESEMALWEDHWILTAQRLQQWDYIHELAKNEGNKELQLEAAWRLVDWAQDLESIEQALSGMSPVATPRRRIFEAFVSLLAAHNGTAKPGEDTRKTFTKLYEEGIQLALRKWYYLPEIVTQAHTPLLSAFQQLVELQEAQQIFNSLANTNATNLDARSAELKGIFTTWRDRLPNLWDDINIWSDLISWRQSVFNVINRAYLPLVPSANSGAVANNSTAYRGYHETAWIINRFAHVARKHQLNEACITSLTKIYTLPNIEIQEAFLKLREQAKCHYQNTAELAQGLEVINNTNLMYFNGQQKAEFFTLKAMFLAKLNLHDDANTTFNLAVSMDMGFAKAWAEWGEYHDRMYRENPHDLNIAANAVSCYLQAAGLYKSSKVRKLLVRILWLLSLDDANGTVSKAFDSYKGEVPTWYWITFIPQLLLALSQREARYARVILLKIAKMFPQSLFFQLRTIREDLAIAKRQHAQAQARIAAQAREAAAANGENGASTDVKPTEGQQNGQSTPQPGANGASASTPVAPKGPTHPWEYVDEIMSVLKTAFPLLALSMEMIVDQISSRFKPSPDEDIYRLVTALLADSLQQYTARAMQANDDGSLASATVSNIARFAENLHPAPVKAQFEKDFLTSSPSLREYVQRLQIWRDRYETLLNKKAKRANLEAVSHWLVEFQYQKFDEIEVPGQYLKHEDNNAGFVRIAQFSNKFDVTRSHGVYFRRLTIIGRDGSLHRFAIQIPSVRTSRREERIMQLFRMLNCPLTTRKEARKRNLQFNVPIVVPLAPGVRLVQNDASILTLQDVFEQHCDTTGLKKDDPILAHTERVRSLHHQQPPLGRPELLAGRQAIVEEISHKMVPDDILKKFMIKTMASPSELWHLRKSFTLSMASFIFMTYVMSMGARVPSRIHISRSTGKIHTSDMLPSIVPNKPEFVNTEQVPFRYTPNFQRFIGPIGTEGVLTSAMLAIARCLTESEHDLEHRLSIFIREEVLVWAQMSKTDPRNTLPQLVLSNVDAVVRRARVMSCKMEREKAPSVSVPVNQSILELLLQATSIQNLSRMEATFAPWL